MDEMEKEDMSDEVIDSNQTILAEGIFAAPKLTPTGKISHAKTRVYTQRYRKEWEQMPDFKGWLTSVAAQPTRAYCIYCKKNLHAHRLSLLKHTCTMKHQRAALLAQSEDPKKSDLEESDKVLETDVGFEEVTVVGSIKNLIHEDEDEVEEYVVESLEVEDEEEEETNDSNDMQTNQEDEMENARLSSGDEEDKSPAKKIKLEHYPRRDALAEAMIHVHGDYLDQNDDGTVGLDMEVESETTILPDREDEEASDGEDKAAKSKIKHLQIEDTSVSETSQKSKIVAYKINSADLSELNLQGGNTVTISTNNNKTLTLNTGKTVTLNASKIGNSTQFVLSKVKGNLPALVMAGSKSVNHRQLAPKCGVQTSPSNSVLAVASTSANIGQEVLKQQEIQKQNDVVKNPCISTHVMDTSKGTPVAGLQVSLYKLMDGRWTFLNESTTSGSGRCTDLVNTGKTAFTAGRYKMHFDVDKYFTLRRIETLYPFIEIVFDVKNPTGNYHIPVLLSPYGYTTYRGSDR
ncbi:uncharacterized protein [Fopius arisanus]|uniref:hydroxyisourate hydrolase n=1 Tax=Fopius arisanus TaxID=64838 RepID=A0A0C9RXY3_9HYME|nr:PREDICTED: uncharacterized protein LOC105274187 [Fopius arisanus]